MEQNSFSAPGKTPGETDLGLRLQHSDLITKTEKKESNLFTDAYNLVSNHPVEAGIAIALGTLGIAALSRRIAAAELRETLLKQQIPDIERPVLSNSMLNLEKLTASSSENYANDLGKLWAMPRVANSSEGEILGSFAERILKDRARLTGERINPDAIGKELERIAMLNPGLNAETTLSGQSLKIIDEAGLAKAAEELQFKHVPQIGQFLKGTGKITEEQIQEALKIQKSLAPAERKLIGEIMVENNLAAQADVDLAFANQGQLKAALKSVREKFFLETMKNGL